MKATLLIAASLIATAATAQTAPDPAAPMAQPPADMSTQAPAPTPAPDMTPAPAPDAAPAPAAPMAPMASAPDASGTASGAMPTPPDTSNYPACSRTVHDQCVQSHEMGRKKAMRPHR